MYLVFVYVYVYVYRKKGSRKKVFVKGSMSKRKKNVVFYLFLFLDYQTNYYEV